MSFIAVAAGVGIAAGAANAISGWKKKKAAAFGNRAESSTTTRIQLLEINLLMFLIMRHQK